MEELQFNPSQMTPEMSNSIVCIGSNTDEQLSECKVRCIDYRKIGKSPGRDTDCYGLTLYHTIPTFNDPLKQTF